MPRRRRAPRKRSNTLARNLSEATDYIVILRLIGTGLSAQHSEYGRAVLAATWALSARIAALRGLLRRNV